VSYTVEVAPRAERQLKQLARKLPKGTFNKIAEEIDALAKNPRPRHTKKLEDTSDFYRIDIKDYRIVYTIQDNRLVVLIVKVAHRREVYSKKLK
jgi:mRNA interferase RelE/StbE